MYSRQVETDRLSVIASFRLSSIAPCWNFAVVSILQGSGWFRLHRSHCREASHHLFLFPDVILQTDRVEWQRLVQRSRRRGITRCSLSFFSTLNERKKKERVQLTLLTAGPRVQNTLILETAEEAVGAGVGESEELTNG